MAQFHGFDNEYGRLVHFARALTTPSLLGELLQVETAPLSLHFQLLLSDGVSQTIELTASEQQPGEAIEPASSVPMPQVNSAKMGWQFLDEPCTVAYLRADSMMRYREALEMFFATGQTSYLKYNLDEATSTLSPETLPKSIEERIALVPSATDMLRDLFSAMREAKTPYLIVDLRFCPGGNSAFVWILDYFLYGLEDSIARFDEGYQVKRYSAHFFQVNANLSPDDEKYRQALRNGATLFGVPSSQAGNCFIDALPFVLTNSQLEGFVSFKRSLLFPDDPERGNVLRPDYVLTYDYLAARNFDPHATVRMALEEYALARKPFQRITKDSRVMVQ